MAGFLAGAGNLLMGAYNSLPEINAATLSGAIDIVVVEQVTALLLASSPCPPPPTCPHPCIRRLALHPRAPHFPTFTHLSLSLSPPTQPAIFLHLLTSFPPSSGRWLSAFVPVPYTLRAFQSPPKAP